MPLALIPLIAILLKMLIVRIIIATGITFVSVIGYQFALKELKTYLLQAVNQLPQDIINLLLIGGFGTGFGYLFGAFSFWVSMRSLTFLSFRMPS